MSLKKNGRKQQGRSSTEFSLEEFIKMISKLLRTSAQPLENPRGAPSRKNNSFMLIFRTLMSTLKMYLYHGTNHFYNYLHLFNEKEKALC